MSKACSYKEIPKNFYNKTLISDLCIENKFYEDNESCDYGEWDWCIFHFTRPGLVVRDDLNQFNVTCQSRKEDNKKGNCLIEENCFCIATGDYEGYFNPDLPILKCKCYSKKSTYIPPISRNGKEKDISNKEEKNKCECQGQKTNRRICEICNTFLTKNEGKCELLKEKHSFENTIDCTDPAICTEIGKRLTSYEYSRDYLEYGLKWLGFIKQPNEQSVRTYGFPFKSLENSENNFRTRATTVFKDPNAQCAFLLLIGIALFLFIENYFKKKKKTKKNSKDENSTDETSRDENTIEK